jgi:DNA-binding transcriptional regulator YdaS (Cro superfamily)
MNGMAVIRGQHGLSSWLATQLNLTPAAISAWRRVPAERVLKIEEITGIPRYVLRSDLWPPPWQPQKSRNHAA